MTLDITEGPRGFDVTPAAVTDWADDDERDAALVFRDVTGRRTREQRLAVLNRVRRHSLPSNATGIIGRARLIGDDGDPGGSAERIVKDVTGEYPAVEITTALPTGAWTGRDSLSAATATGSPPPGHAGTPGRGTHSAGHTKGGSARPRDDPAVAVLVRVARHPFRDAVYTSDDNH